MVERTANVIRKIDALPADEQELVAKFLDEHFEDVVDDARWQQLFDRSGSLLDRMGDEVDAAIAKSQIAPFDPHEL